MADLMSQPTLEEISPSPDNASPAIDSNPIDINGLSNDKVNILEQLPSQSPTTPNTSCAPAVFAKIRLKETDDMLLFENNSYTVLCDTVEAKAVEEDNNRYDYLVIGKGKHRKTINVETQTVDALYKTRAINTDHIEQSAVGTFVSNYDMYDTYANLERTTESLDIEHDDRHEKLEVTTYSRDGCTDLNEQLATSRAFQLSSMILQRMLAGNVFREHQRRFRNMELPNPLDPIVQYLYRIRLLYKYRSHETAGMAVSCMSWCPMNTDILAIGYGVFKFVPCKERRSGAVCLWNIKNPVNPERCLMYTVPVTSVSFSLRNSQLLAMGLYDGTVQIVDITENSCSVSLVAISERKTSPPMEPVWQIKWIKIAWEEEILTISQDGFVMKYALTQSPFLIGSRQMQLHKVEGVVEGVPFDDIPCAKKIQANRQSQALLIQMHPTNQTVYYVGTDEGCLHECSVFYPFQHKRALRVHKYGVFSMEFSPWSPKIFLTCGADWFIRIWIDGIADPIIELRNGFESIQCASWCPTNSTIIVCTTRSKLNLWDLKTNCLLPAATHNFTDARDENCVTAATNSATTELTVCQFTNCGRSVVVGTEDGSACVYALEDMPFSPHFQYDALEQAIIQNLALKPDLVRQIRRLGFLGYKN